jgi:hypothetical protein
MIENAVIVSPGQWAIMRRAGASGMVMANGRTERTQLDRLVARDLAGKTRLGPADSRTIVYMLLPALTGSWIVVIG